MNMKKLSNSAKFVLLLIPLLIGFLVNRDSVLMTFYLRFSRIFSIILLILWGWVGSLFAQSENKIKSYMIGNSLWALGLMLYIWQYIIKSEQSMNFIILILSQLYVVFVLPTAVLIMKIFTSSINGIHAIILSYGLMIVSFSIGFFYRVKN
ncbi:hypothetical protein [Alkaliphilus transvaalensis]|uniref:hypothetical protein n=1 Tax=Alkaliphilus transvaalensis TaxID=114628 RepID=UPI00047960EF|nr:hypothetical protein [Alkaliphilus transvaalensis]